MTSGFSQSFKGCGTDMTIYTCPNCASVNVFADAYVGVNDPDDVRTFSSFFCMDCETTTKRLIHRRTTEEFQGLGY